MTRRVLTGAALGVVVAAGLLAWHFRSRTMPNVVLVVVDTLRADRLGAYGSTPGLTPFLDALAARGAVFANAYATSSWTNPSVASLLTSRYPSQTRIEGYDSKLASEEVTLAEVLHPHRYGTFGFSANFRLTRALGFAQGFDVWGSYATDHKVSATQLARRAFKFVDFFWTRRTRTPIFLYLHLMEPHSPYDPPPRFAPRSVSGSVAARVNRELTAIHWDALAPADVDLLARLYDAEVRGLDARLRRVFEQLQQRGVLDNAIVVITADHGEEFREHGYLLHGTSLFNELLRVPLIVLAPRVRGGVVVHEDVSLVDVAPTILALAHLPPEPRFEGRSLVPLLDGGAEGHVDVLAELPPTGTPGMARHARALVRGDTKLVVPRSEGGRDGAPLLYDLAHDPAELHPIAAPAELATSIAELETRLAARAGTAQREPLDERTRERLRALGYAD